MEVPLASAKTRKSAVMNVFMSHFTIAVQLRSLNGLLALVPGLLTVRLECRYAYGFSFRAVRYPRAVRSHVAIPAIELGEVAGQFVTHRELVGRRVPAGIRRAAALHFQREGSRPREVVCRTSGHRFQQPDGGGHLPGGRNPALGRTIDHVDLRLRLV